MKFKAFSKAASIAALVASAAVVAAPAQKASAQVTGAGASSITTLADLVRTVNGPAVNPGDIRYVVTGSGTGRTLFTNGTTDYVATDLTLPSVPGQVVFNEATLNVAFPYNVPGFNGNLTGAQACQILNGTITNWSAVGGPNLPIIRVARGDSSGTTDTLQGDGSSINPLTGRLKGFVDACNVGQTPGTPNFINDIRGPRVNGIDDGTKIPNPNGNEIIVPAASVNGVTPDPFGAAAASGDDDNSGSYTLGILNTVSGTPGAIGYTETAAAASATLAGATDIIPGQRITTIAIGPTYVVFRGSGNTDVAAARNACLAFTDARNLVAAGFKITINPDNTVSGPEVGADTVVGGSPRCLTEIN